MSTGPLNSMQHSTTRERFEALAKKAENLQGIINNEEATRVSLIYPFLRAWGYDPADPQDVEHEKDVSFGAKKELRIDLCIKQSGRYAMLMECKQVNADLPKAWSQLAQYFASDKVNARIGVLTDGIHYFFYGDLDADNIMDKEPFLEIDLLRLTDQHLLELDKLSKEKFNPESIRKMALTLKYVNRLKLALLRQLNGDMDANFVKWMYRQAKPTGPLLQKSKAEIMPAIERALQEFVKENGNSAKEEAKNVGDV